MGWHLESPLRKRETFQGLFHGIYKNGGREGTRSSQRGSDFWLQAVRRHKGTSGGGGGRLDARLGWKGRKKGDLPRKGDWGVWLKLKKGRGERMVASGLWWR